jgi:hypothetical protein
MKITNHVAIAALLSCSMMTPVTPAISAVPLSSDKTAFCDAYLLSLGHAGDANWRVSVVDDSGPNSGLSAKVADTDRDVNPRRVENENFDYRDFLLASGALGRHGGSPNLWAQATFGKKTFKDSVVDVEARFEHTDTYSWACQTEELVTTTTGGNGGGSGNNGNNNGENLQTGGNGDGNNGCGNGNSGPIGTNPNEPQGCNGETRSDWTLRDKSQPNEVTDLVDEGFKQIATDQARPNTQYPNVNYDLAGPFPAPGIYSLACISPGSKGGSWKAKTYYTGGDAGCIEGGKNFYSQTYISGRQFDPVSSNSLPN